MLDLPTETSALAALVFALGLRHGLDADHLAAIDGLTRLNALRRPAFARWCGVLFALGHGAAVLAISALVALASRHVAAPPWLDALGAWVSIGFLAALGIANLRALLAAAPGEAVAVLGIQGRLLGRLQRAGHPVTVALVGLLFALSFDTVSLAALFGVAGGPGLPAALGLGALFVLGMLLVDGLNGWWIGRLIARADRTAVRASRLMSAAVAGFSLLLAAIGAARRLSPGPDGWGTALGLLAAAAALLACGCALARIRVGARRVERV